MKKNKIIQFSLVTIAIILFFFTYYFSNDKEKVTDIDIDQNTLIEDAAKSGREISNIIENANYNGTDNRGTFFKLKIMSAKKFGTLIVLNSKNRLVGTYSDGDARRDSNKDSKKLKVKDLMTKNPITVQKNILAEKCLRIMQNNRVTKIIVTKKDNKVEGLISIHHIIDTGIK